MDVHARLRQLLDERGWSEYKLSKMSGLSEATVSNVYRRNTLPSIPTLGQICNGFGITLSQFFCEKDMVELTPDLKRLFDGWIFLTPKQREAVLTMIESYKAEDLS